MVKKDFKTDDTRRSLFWYIGGISSPFNFFAKMLAGTGFIFTIRRYRVHAGSVDCVALLFLLIVSSDI